MQNNMIIDNTVIECILITVHLYTALYNLGLNYIYPAFTKQSKLLSTI